MTTAGDPPSQRFRIVLQRSDTVGSTCFFEVPAAVIVALSTGKRPPVTATINGHSWRSTVAVYGGQFFVPVRAEHRAAAKVAPGDAVEVTLGLDRAPRIVVLPGELEQALAEAGLTEAFRQLSRTRQTELAQAVGTAKRPETKQARLAKALDSAAARRDGG
jgi:hypothetical protein